MNIRAFTPFSFQPAADGMGAIQANTTSNNVALASDGDQLRLVNAGSDIAYINFGSNSSVTATVNCLAMLTGVSEIFSIPLVGGNRASYLAVRAASTNTILQFSTGWGS